MANIIKLKNKKTGKVLTLKKRPVVKRPTYTPKKPGTRRKIG